MKRWSGKLIGMWIGFILGHLPGLLIGLIVGHLFDIRRSSSLFNFNFLRTHPQSTSIFFNTTFQVMGYLAKVDGRVSEQEIAKARQIMQHMQLSPDMTQEAIHLFTEGKNPTFNLEKAIRQFKQTCFFHPSLLHTFLEIQIQMAYADGNPLSAKKYQAMQNICAQLGLPKIIIDQITQRFHTQREGHAHRHHTRRPGSTDMDLDTAYKILNIPPTSTRHEIKKAYRRLMNQHHPDKLIAKGFPPEMIKLATQKTQQIKTAYEQIKKVHPTPL